MAYKYLFGPVPSRRLGMSLGVDLVPKKVCSLDCVYCEVGKTTKLTTQRMEYIPYDKIIAELDHFFAHQPDPDYFTFSGSGEPTLNSRLGDVLRYIKQHRPHVPIAVLTNGTLLSDKQVRDELIVADVILPSMDAITTAAFERINRPEKSLTVEKYLQGLIDFRNEFSNKLLLEIFILPGYNDQPEELQALHEALVKIRPDAVQLNTLDRPGTIPGLHACSTEQLERIVRDWKTDNVEIIAASVSRKAMPAYRQDAESVIWQTIVRRPCTLEDLVSMLGMHRSEINKYLDVLSGQGRIESITEPRGTFYQIKNK
ncbi:MAG: radical SAM protein [Spartobacteria bacterium]|nr:radical SAM protein [Spartobacteria bacterium]